MKKLIDQLKEAQQNGKDRVQKLAETIENDKKALKELQNQHQILVLEDEDEKADELSGKIYDLKRSIAINEDKYKILSQPGKVRNSVKEIAEKILEEAGKERERLSELEKKKEKELEELREVYFKKIEEIGQVNKQQEEVADYDAIAEKAINPKYERPYPTSYHSDMRRFHFKIDSENLIWDALKGNRTEGRTR